jgi:hypothetical protein
VHHERQVTVLVSNPNDFVLSILSYNINARKELREIDEKQPVADIQVIPKGISSGLATISVNNPSDFNVVPQDITVLPSLEAGEFYFSSNRQRIDDLKSSLNLRPMGIIAPKGAGKLEATLAGVMDGKDDAFKSGVELQFVIRLRLGDARDTIKTIDITRNIRRWP